jgi:exopolyphosphatase / guanosine-5'-triphosphate,3'-diphosphate pyrophosphatase
VADVDPAGARLIELDRRTVITRLGQGVDATGALHDDAIARVVAVLAEYRAAIDALRAERTVAVLTSAVRDATNGPGSPRACERSSASTRTRSPVPRRRG